ncbi:rhamnan synthesis F family protein [Salipiger sp. PrR002]|uniref:rhamnan synthesis F family protein n=1 Tax=Salipiger sp. PrR002 TaxID=2706489 RepID=UPI0013B78B33|nr:rhamnan synthesis F family protein [Salipiger sp. PrR002]NDW01316.1 hypothetical protein [Salipiger sp. PrR002]NDW58895.1 hypothetical protein [Salipiger sp. PrR004]
MALLRSRDEKCIRNSRFFDAGWYRQSYADVRGDAARHYLKTGALVGYDPGPEFSTQGYLAANPDVAAAGLNPLLHYERHGRAEGRTGHETGALQPVAEAAAEPTLPTPCSDYAVIVHAFHPGCFDDLRRALANFPETVDRYVSYPRGSQAHSEAIIRDAFPGAVPVAVDNLGQDVGAFLQVLQRIGPGKYAFFCKLHSKVGDKLPSIWREALLRGTVGSSARVAQFEQLFRMQPELMLGGTRELFLHGPSYVMENGVQLGRLLEKAGLSGAALDQDWGFFAGTFFWMRAAVAEQLLGCIDPAEFSAGKVQRDGQLAHAGERLAGLLSQAMGGQVALASCLDLSAAVEVLSGLPDESPRSYVPMMQLLQSLQTGWIGRRVEAMVAGREPGLGSSRVYDEASRAVAQRADYAIITPTGDRPEAFRQCIRMVATQTVQPQEWIVVDDGRMPLLERVSLPDWVTYVRRDPAPDDPPHTLSCNVLAALEHVSADRVLIVEDDDWYSPLYAEFMLPWLECYDLVGLNLIRYYHLQGRAWKHGHPPAHTAFAQSAFRRGHAWEHLAAVCRTGFPEVREKGVLDRYWWHSFEGKKYLVDAHPCLHLGLKGGFGRPGLASGHDRAEVDYIPDRNGAYMEVVLGPDVVHYARFRKRVCRPFALCTVVSGQGAAQELPDLGLPFFDCYVFSDVKMALPPPWQQLPLDWDKERTLDTMARGKALSHKNFPDYEWTVWVTPEALSREDIGRAATKAIAAKIAVLE